ncbi:MAG: exo-alpha-sialidase [Clostridia bacterium]|nr:exo-alpha-sialidase [Clostridia bacterium]
MKKHFTIRSIIAFILLFSTLIVSSCAGNKTDGPENTDGTTANTEGTTATTTKKEDPEVDPDYGFANLIEELKPIAAWNCEAVEGKDGVTKDAVSGAEATLVKSEIVNGYSGCGVKTLAVSGGYMDLGTGFFKDTLNEKSAITISMWVMPYVNYNSTNYRLVSFPIDEGKGGVHIHYQSTGIKIGGRSEASDSFRSQTYEYTLANTELGTLASHSNEGQWQHIACTIDFANKKITLYVNGIMQTSSETAAFSASVYKMGTPTDVDAFGGAPAENVYSFNGIMDNIFVFDRALKTSEVRELRNQSGDKTSPIVDQLLLNDIITRMGKEPSFYEGCTNALYDGMVVPLDESDFSAACVKHNGELLIPAASAAKYFTVVDGVPKVQLDGKEYQSLKKLCEANQKGYLEYEKMAVVMPSSDTFTVESDKQMLDRMVKFFGEPAATTPFTSTELTRTVVVKKGDVFSSSDLNITISGSASASPSIVKIGDTIYTSVDYGAVNTLVFASKDGGKTYEFVSIKYNLKFSTLVEVDGDLYLVGVDVDGATGRYAGIARSTDGGKTWSNTTRLPNNADGYAAHGSSNSVLIANGRIYKAYAGQGINGLSFSWKKGCSIFVESAPIDSDLLDASNWTVSSTVKFDTNVFLAHQNTSKTPTYVYAQEPNVVLAKDGSVWVMARIDSNPIPGYSLRLRLSEDCKTLTYDKNSKDSIISFDGGITKYTVRYDSATGKYLALVNNTLDERSSYQRNVLSLAVSDDMINWTIKATLLVDRSIMNDYISITRHAFQNADWVIDGDDIIIAIREAMGDSENYHNANYHTTYRFSNYKEYVNG